MCPQTAPIEKERERGGEGGRERAHRKLFIPRINFGRPTLCSFGRICPNFVGKFENSSKIRRYTSTSGGKGIGREREREGEGRCGQPPSRRNFASEERAVALANRCRQIAAAFHVNSAVADKGSQTINYSNINPLYDLPLSPSLSFSPFLSLFLPLRPLSPPPPIGLLTGAEYYTCRKKFRDILNGNYPQRLSAEGEKKRGEEGGMCPPSFEMQMRLILILNVKFFKFLWKQVSIPRYC